MSSASQDQVQNTEQSTTSGANQSNPKRMVVSDSKIPPEHPIEYWRKRLLGKTMIAEDEEGDETVRVPRSNKSDSTMPAAIHQYIMAKFQQDFQEIRSSRATSFPTWSA